MRQPHKINVNEPYMQPQWWFGKAYTKKNTYGLKKYLSYKIKKKIAQLLKFLQQISKSGSLSSSLAARLAAR